MSKRRFVAASAVTMMWLFARSAIAYAADNERPESRPTVVYRLGKIDAQVVAESLNRLFHGREDIGISSNATENELVIVAARKDQKTLRAFLSLVARRDSRARVDAAPPPKLMFPEDVERAMIGEGCRSRPKWLQELIKPSRNVPDPLSPGESRAPTLPPR